MMNILALGLVLTSLVTAAVWSPSPGGDEVIVKEGHRVVVVEYEKEADGHTKVLISPHEDFKDTEKKQEADEAEGKLSGPRELVCDAFGKCKHKIAQALGKTKDMEEHAKEAATGALGKAKDIVHGYEEDAKETVKEVIEEGQKGTEEKAHTNGGKVAQGIGKARKVAGDVVSTVKDGALKAKEFDVVDSPKRIGEDIQRNVTGKVEEGAEQVMEQAKETVANLEKKSLGEILRKLQDVAYDVIWYVVSRDKLDALVGLIHILGFSTAYGMCVWVTFVSSYILGRYLPRQQFGMVQSRIYPVYFKAMAYCVSAALLGHVASRKNKSSEFQSWSLVSALLMVLANMMWLEPRATKLMYERMKIEKEEGRGIAGAAKEGIEDEGSDTVDRPPPHIAAERQDVVRLNEKLKRLNTYSSAFNVSTLLLLTWHMASMAQRLQPTR